VEQRQHGRSRRARSSRWWVVLCLCGLAKAARAETPIHETNDLAPLAVMRIARGAAGLPPVLLGAVPSAIAASPIDPLAADQQSDRVEILQDAIDRAFDAAQARKATQAAPLVPKEFSVRINAPIYYNSNILLGQSGLEGDPEIALGWSPSWASLPFKPTVKLKADTDRYTNVPQVSQDEATGSFKLSYYDASDDQAWRRSFHTNWRRYTPRRFRRGSRPRTISTSASTSSSVSMATFILPAANSQGAAVWTLGITAYVQRRVRTSLSDSLALYVVPNATYLPSADWVIALSLETWERWYQGITAKPISRRDFEINPGPDNCVRPVHLVCRGQPSEVGRRSRSKSASTLAQAIW
jgi:hypothetical protein